CTICRISVSCASGGKNDVKRHLESKNHLSNRNVAENSQSLKNVFVTEKEAFSVIKAETIFANFVARYNLPFTVADHFTKMVPIMFPDSSTAKKYASGKTKTTKLIKGSLAPNLDDDVAEKPFGLMCDESNDQGGEKDFVTLVRLYNEEEMAVKTRFLDMPKCNIGSTENLFNCLDESFRKSGISWNNVVAYNSDNASVVKGRKNSVYSRSVQRQPNVMDMGCICHLVNLAVGAAMKMFPLGPPLFLLPVEDLLVDIQYTTTSTTVPKKKKKEFQEFTNVDPLKILKHCLTRWLSLQKCRVNLQQWPALQAYFNSHEDMEKKGHVRKVGQLLADPEMKLYFNFLQFILAPLVSFNTAFQSEDIKLATMHSDMKIMGFFVPIKTIKAAAEDLSKVTYKGIENQVSDSDLNIGNKARVLLINSKDEITHETERRFFKSVRRFFETVTEKMLRAFPIGDQLLKDMTILSPEEKENIPAQTVINVAKRSPQVIQEKQLDKLREEFTDYQLTEPGELPSEEKLDLYWGKVSQMKAAGEPRFPTLSRLMKTLLVIPHSNASSERIFSLNTDFRGDLGKDTIHSLLSCKVNNDRCCHDTMLSTKVFRDCKSATWSYNQNHSSKAC
uniref:HAT C-terminal dimerisation domain-containing protein n=1 Tax=Latimeria chalumnae TaxID=7897 RepID=H2ZUA5_LATCH